jgi:hypothetical protein
LERSSIEFLNNSKIPYNNNSVGANSGIDARPVFWIGDTLKPFRIGGGANVCASGGEFTGTFPLSTSWSDMHNTYALEIRGPDYLLENMKVHNYGDCIAVLEAGDRFHISGMRCSQIRDDFVSDDLGWSGIVEDSLFDGGYVFFSDRGNRVAASDAVVEIKNNLVRLQVFDQTFTPGEVGHGWFWKLDADAVKISLHGNIFFTNEASMHGSIDSRKDREL